MQILNDGKIQIYVAQCKKVIAPQLKHNCGLSHSGLITAQLLSSN